MTFENHVPPQQFAPQSSPGWPRVKLGWISRIASGVSQKVEVGDFPLYGANGIIGQTNVASYEHPSVLIGRVGTAGAVTYADGRFGASDNALVVSPHSSVNARFLFFSLSTIDFSSYVSETAQPLLTGSALKGQYLLLPPFEEQCRIAAFLDHETARIDELVREQEQLVNHLVEKKFSLTWNAVTGGDRSDRVSTSVEWLPTIPRNWKLANLGYLVACLDGKRIPLNAEERATMPGVVPYWGANGVVDYVAKPLFDERLVLIGEDGAPFFDRTKPVAFVVNEPIWPNNHIHVLRPRDRSAEEAEWLASVLNVTDYVGFVEGATRDKLTQGRLLKIPIPVPPSEERDRLLAGLRPSLIEADTLLKEAQHMVDVLLERRSSLISAAVTGHLDLQDWRPHEAEAVAEVA